MYKMSFIEKILVKKVVEEMRKVDLKQNEVNCVQDFIKEIFNKYGTDGVNELIKNEIISPNELCIFFEE